MFFKKYIDKKKKNDYNNFRGKSMRIKPIKIKTTKLNVSNKELFHPDAIIVIGHLDDALDMIKRNGGKLTVYTAIYLIENFSSNEALKTTINNIINETCSIHEIVEETRGNKTIKYEKWNNMIDVLEKLPDCIKSPIIEFGNKIYNKVLEDKNKQEENLPKNVQKYLNDLNGLEL